MDWNNHNMSKILESFFYLVEKVVLPKDYWFFLLDWSFYVCRQCIRELLGRRKKSRVRMRRLIGKLGCLEEFRPILLERWWVKERRLSFQLRDESWFETESKSSSWKVRRENGEGFEGRWKRNSRISSVLFEMITTSELVKTLAHVSSRPTSPPNA